MTLKLTLHRSLGITPRESKSFGNQFTIGFYYSPSAPGIFYRNLVRLSMGPSQSLLYSDDDTHSVLRHNRHQPDVSRVPLAVLSQILPHVNHRSRQPETARELQLHTMILLPSSQTLPAHRRQGRLTSYSAFKLRLSFHTSLLLV